MGADPFVSKAVESLRRRHGLGRRNCLGYERPPERSLGGTMACPSCGGLLDYTVSSYDGTTRGRCRKRGCLRWTE
jgi:hypothetical protein